MAKVRTFKGHEGVIPPTGLIPNVTAEEAEEAYAARAEAEATKNGTTGAPDSGWTVAQLDSWAAANGVTFPSGAVKAEKVKIASLAYDDARAVTSDDDDDRPDVMDEVLDADLEHDEDSELNDAETVATPDEDDEDTEASDDEDDTEEK